MSAAIDLTLAALAEPSRRKVVEALRERPRAAGELAKIVGLSPPALSRHLKTLREAGLIQESHPVFDARVRIYALRAEPMQHLSRWLEQTEQMWVDQLVMFKGHIEAASEVLK